MPGFLQDAGKRRAALWLLIAIGLLLSGYLTYQHYFDGAFFGCPSTGVINCEAVASSQYSSILGIPLALLGLLLYILAVWMVFHDDTTQFLWSVAGAASILYSVVSMGLIGSICIYCTALDVTTLAVVAILHPSHVGSMLGPQK